MEIRTIVTATCAALGFAMASPASAHAGEAETVTTNFEAAIPNIPGKSLVAVEVNYAPGAASPSPHPREIGFHLRLCDLGRDRVDGE